MGMQARRRQTEVEKIAVGWYLGLDTSNYTTSTALYDSDGNRIFQSKRLLPVKEGALGLRQADAVFAHVKQLGTVTEQLCAEAGRHVNTGQGGLPALAGIGYSARPRDAEGSYMPCFLVGEMAARVLAAVQGVPCRPFSHQAGHIAAALYSGGRLDLAGETFLAFHLSGGTTECLLVSPGVQTPFQVELLGQSLDLKAGQVVDRVGRMLGLSFPAGPQLDRLAQESSRKFRFRPVLREGSCSLSGIENQCQRMVDEGEASCDIARYAIESILASLVGMTDAARIRCGDLPLVYSGGVMSNSMIRQAIRQRYPKALFAQTDFSCDNAAGVAVLAALSDAGSSSGREAVLCEQDRL